VKNITVPMNFPVNNVIRDLDGAIERFKNREFTKSQTIAFITTCLNFNLSKDEPEKHAALDRYLSTIDSCECLASGSVKHGACVTTEIGGLHERRDLELRALNENLNEMEALLKSFIPKKDSKHQKHQCHLSYLSSSSSDTSDKSLDDN
jgi:hypothetical protein